MKVAVLGGGAFGTALAVSLAANGPVTLWARNAGAWKDRACPKLEGVTLPDPVTLTGDVAEALRADALLFATPMQSLAGLLDGLPEGLEGKALVACCKGIDLTRLTGPAAILAERAPDAVPAILTGPSFAADIARCLPTALTLACADEAMGKALQQALSTPALRLYRSRDVIGAELGGALKNVVAIACGACIGAGLGDSARAALMTRGFAEMTRLAAHLGASPETLAGLSGLGDLTLTCTSDLSRNYRFGLALGRGEAFDAGTTVEGAATAQAAEALGRRDGIPLPICGTVSRLTEGALTVPEAMDQLLTRPLKEE